MYSTCKLVCERFLELYAINEMQPCISLGYILIHIWLYIFILYSFESEPLSVYIKWNDDAHPHLCHKVKMDNNKELFYLENGTVIILDDI